MHLSIETITPSKAKQLLSHNKGNRALRKDRVDFYAKQMLDGVWRPSHQGIALGKDGRLLDGQHRLAAVIHSGVTITIPVARDVDAAVFDVLDSGLQRSVADRTGMSNTDVGVCTFIYRLAFEGASSRKAIAAKDIEYVHTRFSDALTVFRAKGTSTRKGITNAPIITAVLLLIKEGHAEYALKQYHALANLDILNLSPAAAAFYKQVNQGTTVNTSSGRDEMFARAYKALHPANAHVTKIAFKDVALHIDLLASKLAGYIV